MQSMKAFTKVREELADGLRGPNFLDFDWGFIFEWLGSRTEGTNMALIHPGQLVDKAIEEINLNNNITHVWIEENKELSNQQFREEKAVNFMERKPRDTSVPVLKEMSVRRFSFDTRDLNFKVENLTSGISDQFDLDEEAKFEMERYIGGILHMLNGEIWALEDLGGNYICFALVSHIVDEQKNIEFLVTKEYLRRKGHGKTLLRHLISTYASQTCTAVVPDNLIEMFQDVNFRREFTMKIWKRDRPSIING